MGGPEVWYLPRGKYPDVDARVISKSFKTFTLPSDEEGFHRIEFLWRSQSEASGHLQRWVTSKKAENVVDGLKPSEWFKDKLKAWKELRSTMETKQKEIEKKKKKKWRKKKKKKKKKK